MLTHRRHHRQHSGEPLVGVALHVPPAGQQPGRIAGLEHDRPEQHVADLLSAKVEPGDHSTPRATTAQRPEQVGVLAGGDLEDLPGRGDQLRPDQAVDRQTVPARHPPDTAAQGESADADAGRVPRSDAQPVRLQGRGHRTPGSATADPHDPGRRIHLDLGHAAQVEEQPVGGQAEAGHAMPARPDGQSQAIPVGGLDCRGNVRGTARTHHQLGVAVAEQGAGGIAVLGVTSAQHRQVGHDRGQVRGGHRFLRWDVCR